MLHHPISRNNAFSCYDVQNVCWVVAESLFKSVCSTSQDGAALRSSDAFGESCGPGAISTQKIIARQEDGLVITTSAMFERSGNEITL